MNLAIRFERNPAITLLCMPSLGEHCKYTKIHRHSEIIGRITAACRFQADIFGRSASDQDKSGQSQFAPLKLRSLALVPSSGARSAPSNSTYGSSTARLFPPRQSTPVTDSRSFRAALRALKEIRSRDCARASRPQTLACSSPRPPRAMNAREALCRRDRPCPESAKINIILSRLCHSSHQGSTTAKTASILVGQKPASTALPAAGEHNLDYVNFAPSIS